LGSAKKDFPKKYPAVISIK